MKEKKDCVTQKITDLSKDDSKGIPNFLIGYNHDRLIAKLEVFKNQLEECISLHQFGSKFRDLVSWINDMKAKITAAKLAEDLIGAKTLFERHQKHHDEINQKTSKDFMDMIKEGRKLRQNIWDKLENRKCSLLTLWEDRNKEFKQCLDLQSFDYKIEVANIWMVEKEAFLAKKDLDYSINLVEQLLKNHEDFENSLTAREKEIEALKISANNLINDQHYAADHIAQRYEMSCERFSNILEKSEKRRQSLKYEQLKYNCQEIKKWIKENEKNKLGMVLKFPNNYNEIEIIQNHIENIMATSTYLIEKNHEHSTDISDKKEKIFTLWDEFTESFQPVCSQSSDILVVFGINVKISVISALIKNHTKYVFVFALHKLVMDDDIDIENSMYIAFTWKMKNMNQIIGEKAKSINNFTGIYKRIIQIESSEIQAKSDGGQQDGYGAYINR